MKRFSVGLLVLLIAAGTRAFAQGANVDVTVLPQAAVAGTTFTRAGFLVCVGTTADVDQYGTETTPTSGVANQNFTNLPVGAAVRVTVTKTGYIGVQLNTTLRAGWDNHLQASMNLGSGGPSCATAPTTTTPTTTTVRVSGTSISTVPLTTTAPAARLGRQVLPHWGTALSTSAYRTLDCGILGNNWVATALIGRELEAIDQISVRCSQLIESGKVGPDQRILGPWGGTGGDPYTLACPTAYAIIGFEVHLRNNQLRGLSLKCRRLNGGLVDTSISEETTVVIGDQGGESVSSTRCGSGRPVRAFKLGKDVFRTGSVVDLVAPTIIAAMQVTCEQPRYGT